MIHPHPHHHQDHPSKAHQAPNHHVHQHQGPQHQVHQDHPSPPPHSFAVDRPDFEERVLLASRERPILVDFWADWCSPCHALAPHLARVVDGYGGALHLAKVEVDEGDNMKLAGHYRLRGFPTVILFQDGVELGRFSGSRSSSQLWEWLREHLPGLPAS